MTWPITSLGTLLVTVELIPFGWMLWRYFKKDGGVREFYDPDHPRSKEWRWWHWSTWFGIGMTLLGLGIIATIAIFWRH